MLELWKRSWFSHSSSSWGRLPSSSEPTHEAWTSGTVVAGGRGLEADPGAGPLWTARHAVQLGRLPVPDRWRVQCPEGESLPGPGPRYL